MKQYIGLGILLGCSLLSGGQDTLSDRKLDEVVIYSGKFAEKRKNVVQKIDVVSAQRIAQFNAQNTGDLLINTGNVFVQKSQQGGSSPVIRGFEASRVLLVIDGIRMNNAIYRAGHLQNVITVDQNMLERVEVLYGPASTIYGSDALGGVVHLRTKMPRLSGKGPRLTGGTAFARYSSANNEKTVHADLSTGGKKWAWLQSYNFSDFGDMKMGSRDPKGYPDFWARKQYITQMEGVDTVVKNEDDRVQKFSGYKQWDVTQKLLFRPSEKVSHLLNLQYSGSTDIPRYDRLQDIRNGTLRYAEWYYGPQTRQMAAYELNVAHPLFFDEFRTILSYQHIEESRHQREYRRYDRLDNRLEDLNVYAFTLDGRKRWSVNELTVGVDGQLNDLSSTAFREDIRSGARSILDSRYPNGINRMNYFGLYAQHIWKSHDGRFVVNDGIRLQYQSLRSTIADNSIFRFPFTEIEQDNAAVTGNLGLIWNAAASTRIQLGGATGFRAPNIDDLARIFESSTASQQLIVPNPDIRPEYTYNADLGIQQQFGEKVRLEVTGFYTWFRNAITLAPFRFNHEDSITYNGVRVRVYANQNQRAATLYGLNASLTANLGHGLKAASTINYTKGAYRSEEAKVPLDHIPPVFGRTGISYTGDRLTAEAYALYNGWKRIADFNPSGEDNAQYATPEGMPGWITYNVKASYQLLKQLQLQAGVENIADRNYRYFASGFSAPGRNFIIALRGTL